MADPDLIIDPSALKRIDLLSAFQNRPAAIDMVLPGMIAGTVGALVAQGGAGKSWIALELAVAVAGGPDLLGMGIAARGPVLYLPAEDPHLALEHRFHAVAPQLDAEARQTLSEHLEVIPLMGRSVDLLVPAWVEVVARLGDGRRLIVLDTLRRFHTGDENSGSDMARLLGVLEQICERTGASILFLHHSSKGAALNGGSDQQQASRGSSVLVDNIRGGQFNVSGMTEAEARTYEIEDRRSYVRLSQAKANFGPPMADRWLQRTDGGLLLPARIERGSHGGTDEAQGQARRGRNHG